MKNTENKKSEEKLKKIYKRQNAFIKNNYDRITATLPHGYKSIITDNIGSVNGYINKLVQDDLRNRGLLPGDGSGAATAESDEDISPDEWPFH